MQVAHPQVASAGVSIHEAFVLKYLFVQKALISSVLFEAFWNGLVSIADYKDKEIVLGDVEVLVCPEAVVIVNQSS